MIVGEINANIICPKCGSGFNYSALSTHTKLDTVYKDHLKNYLDNCAHCGKAKLVIKDVKCTLKQNLPKHVYMIKWECKKCGTKWIQTEYMSKDQLGSDRILNKFKSSLVCPHMACGSTDKSLLGILRKK